MTGSGPSTSSSSARADGTAQTVHETHRLGAFRRNTWLRLLTDAGFERRRSIRPNAVGPLQRP